MTKIVAVAGKGGVGKTSLAGAFVKVLVEKYPDKKLLCLTEPFALCRDTRLEALDISPTMS